VGGVCGAGAEGGRAAFPISDSPFPIPGSMPDSRLHAAPHPKAVAAGAGLAPQRTPGVIAIAEPNIRGANRGGQHLRARKKQ